MAIKKLYADVTGCSGISSVVYTGSHQSSSASTTITCKDHSLEIGDQIVVDLGYETNHDIIFRGYVKQMERKVPDNTYIITAFDEMVKAVDYFIVSSTPDSQYSKSNIAAERVVEDLLNMAQITDFEYDPTHFVFAVTEKVKLEVNLTNCYDYCSGIADLLTWHLWADKDKTVHFRNRKPFVMDGTTGQPHDDVDERPVYGTPGSVSIGDLYDPYTLSINYKIDEKDLRNKIVVYGNEDVHADASSATSLDPTDNTMKQVLPSGFYKAAVLASPIIDDNSYARRICDYNLRLMNKLTNKVSFSVEGDPKLIARSIVTLNSVRLGVHKNYYIFMAEHQWSRSGYVTSMELTL